MSEFEDAPLIPKTSWNVVVQRYRKTRKCITSRSAIIVLIWNFFMSLIHVTAIHVSSHQFAAVLNVKCYLIEVTIVSALINLLYPISGLLADLKLGRYTIIVSSIWMVVISTPLILIGSGLLVTVSDIGEERKAYAILISTGSILTITGLLILLCSVIAFSANIIQFGLDQLHDSPAEDQIIFIQWYMWIHYTVKKKACNAHQIWCATFVPTGTPYMA